MSDGSNTPGPAVRRDAPFPHRHVEDYEVGQVFEYGAYEVTEADIIAFGERFDPQYFHIDPEAAKASAYGGLIASGLHTGSIFMRLLIDAFPDLATIGSPGWDELRWLAPVRPGYVLRARTEILDKRLSKSRPEMGIVTGNHVLTNQDGEAVFSVHNNWFVLRRPAGDG
jgi:acyl dehydratase